jgi:aldehyde dehydrogenase (NAD+)
VARASPAGRETSVFERSAILARAARLVREDAERLADTMTLEEGKPLAESRAEVMRTAETLEVFAGLGYRPIGEVLSGHRPGEQWTFTTSAPLGVVVVISPWNFPMLIPAWKMAAALITGNTVVCKPADPSPLTIAAFVAILQAAGVPEGVVNLVIGRGSVLGPALLRPPAAAVSFTGGNTTGRAVAHAALEHHLKYQLELGGNNPVLVLADADMDLVERELIAGVIGSTGQKCTATQRVFAIDGIFDELTRRLHAGFSSKRLGPGIEPGTDVGPLVTAAAREEFERSVAAAEREGIEARRFGEVPDSGFFAAPTMLLEPDPDSDHVQRETFGPMVSLMRVADFEEGALRGRSRSSGVGARDRGNGGAGPR